MHFSDDDLTAALRRKDPGPRFTERVMSSIASKTQLADGKVRPRFTWWPFRFSPALAGAVAGLVLVLVGLIGIANYREQKDKIAQAEKARQEAILALRITNAKLNHVFRRVNQQEAPQPKIRRQSL